MSSRTAPQEIRVSPDRRRLTLRFAEGPEASFEAEMLRVLSPSAEVQGHSPDQRVTVAGKRAVTIADIVPVGHYAIRIRFDDGHDTGIFSWSYFADLDREWQARWDAYLEELAAKGLRRDA
ncbi:hypothetical protein GCM10011390_01720 [Aureimonas endophytica]|uniref:Gamma-butyrobetaine hydroxylase-like N-terminal domain-containing protein n=1 Tax=Aureimonas endophytica TaxID=2027858 RepID=A0A916ZBR2_9HYPH|nr:DUF971 domain-containing protein [Aureimonas endophytica]GGD86767.1 hypothetical protein GCM10011390_01720 [Aureimonas endophytica]